MIDIYKQHSIDKPFIRKNYKDVLKTMEDEGVIKTIGRRSKNGFADDLVCNFPIV